jgi:uncharacterized membrane protein YphA (DoxX/SURF4 family)
MAELVAGQFGASKSKGKEIGLWVLQIASALMFFFVGGSKLAGTEQMVGLFNVIGIGQWFRYLTGGLEVVGAIALLIPALAGLGAALLALVMIGAIATHLFILHSAPTTAAVLLIANLIVAWGRKEQIRKSLNL